MNGSLQRRLSLTLSVCILLSGLIAALASFALAYLDAQELQDDTLRQVAALTVVGTLKAGSGAAGPSDSSDTAISDPESRVTIIRPARETRPTWLPADIPAGLHTLDARPRRMRVFVHDLGNNDRVVTAQVTDVRDEIAINSALRTLVPLILLLPLLIWLTARVVRGQLAPVRRLSEGLDRQTPDQPQPLSLEGVPTEIASFILAINRLLARITQLMGQRRRFIADAAHELRSPLTALSVQAENLEHASSLDVMRGRIGPLRTGISRAQRLTEQLLTLARTQSRGPEPQSVDIAMVVRELIGEVLPLAETRAIDLGLDEMAAPVVFTDPVLLRLVIKTGLENAMNYTPPSGEVTIRIAETNDQIIVEIVDTGPGIPEQYRDLVFDPFHRLPGAPGVGSGLGLTIARDAAARLGGTVSLHDRPDATGLLFRLSMERTESVGISSRTEQ
jgi:two-component system OmpR family sensor kinase